MSRGFTEGFLRSKKDGKDSISYQDKQKLIPGNLKIDVSIKVDGVDVVGTYEGSMKYAKVTKNQAMTIVNDGTGNTNVSITGLAFQPTQVFLDFYVYTTSTGTGKDKASHISVKAGDKVNQNGNLQVESSSGDHGTYVYVNLTNFVPTADGCTFTISVQDAWYGYNYVTVSAVTLVDAHCMR